MLSERSHTASAAHVGADCREHVRLVVHNREVGHMGRQRYRQGRGFHSGRGQVCAPDMHNRSCQQSAHLLPLLLPLLLPRFVLHSILPVLHCSTMSLHKCAANDRSQVEEMCLFRAQNSSSMRKSSKKLDLPILLSSPTHWAPACCLCLRLPVSSYNNSFSDVQCCRGPGLPPVPSCCSAPSPPLRRLGPSASGLL
jgi:hypothetical protein